MTQTLNPDSLPANPYEEYASPGAFASGAEVRARIAEDLKGFGEVTKVSGTILATQRHGLIFQDVSVTLRHPHVRILMKVDVTRDASTGELSYYDARGYRINHSVISYSGATPVSETERAVVDKAMNKMRCHPVWSGWVQKTKNIEHTQGVDKIGAGWYGASVPFIADFLLWDPFIGVTVGASAGMSLLMFKGAELAGKSRKRNLQKEADAAAARWNADPEVTLMGMFSGEQDQAVFMDAFLSLCASAGVDYHGGIQVQRAPQPRIGLPVELSGLHDATKSPLNWDHSPVMTGMINFQGAVKGNVKGNLFFDGRRFYAYFVENGEDIKESMVCPLA